MASADEGDRGPQVGPDDSGTHPQAGPSVEPGPVRPASPHNAVTQLMPLVVAPTSGPPVVRGVAKRVPVALPALGGTEGPRDAPLSARATVDRRRAAARGVKSGDSPTSAPPAAPAGPLVATSGPGVPRAVPTGPLIPTPRSPDPVESVAAGAPATAGLWHLPPPEPAPQPAASAFGKAIEPAVRTGESVAIVVARGPGEGTDLALAVAPARHARPAPATFMIPPRGALATADTGELPVIVDPADGGPPVLDADSWDSAPDAQPRNEDYLGRRRATALPMRILVVIGLVLLGLAAAVVIPLVLGSPTTPQAGPGAEAAGNGEPTGFIPHNEGELISAASSPGTQPTKTVAAPAPAAPAASPTVTAGLAGPPPTATTTAPPAGAFQLSLSAVSQGAHQNWQVQANTVCGSGQVVLTGRWEGQSGPGTLIYSSVSVPATGNYFMTISYGTSAGQDRTEEIRVNNASVNTGGSFPTGCKTRKIQVNFSKTTGNTISFTNQNSRGISISQIVISTS